MSLQDDLLQTSQRESMHMENVFYHGTINLTSKIETHICEMNLAVVCVFGSSYSEVLATKVVNNCNGRCKPFGGHKNNSFIYDVRHYLARYCNYHACRMCCWFHKKSAEIYKNATTDSGKNVPELLINKQYVQQNGEQTQTTELIIKTNPIPTSRMSYVNKENSVVNIHTETTYNCVDMSSNYVGRSLALDTAHQVPLVNTMNNDQITIKFQN
ncbi:Hypothetical predicted protein [Mytilus galloprovincialis]|uniref:Uncharacterized protein n=1 Tax=Mytilus galloprovincialis TaxID=29158 RepID=A0A8B6DAT1_MYTGA|nr:Hypothetical predicted protein [Mytilus galloprovincialis]